MSATTAPRVLSRAPLARIEAFRKRMGWTFRWVSSRGRGRRLLRDEGLRLRGARRWPVRGPGSPLPGWAPCTG